MKEVDLANKRVVIREDLNVPMEKGKIANDTRIKRALPTIKKALDAKAKVLVLSHLGRPKEGSYDKEFSLAPVAEALSKELGQSVDCVKDWLDGVDIKSGQVVLAENVRFNVGENENDEALSKKMAALCDVFVMDAFATAHRAQASTVGIAKYAPIACAGPLLVEELDALSKALLNPKHPVVAIIGGSKISTKIKIIESLLDKVDTLIVGGGIANTFLAAEGVSIGKSLYEKDWVEGAKKLMQQAKEKNVELPLPKDVAVAESLSPEVEPTYKTIDEITSHESIFDVGPKTAETYSPLMQKAGTIIWNGPVGVFEMHPFSAGTEALGDAIAKSSSFSIVGGGDTIAALDAFGIADKISYISTGGGAFLSFLQGETLPTVAVLESRAKSQKK